MWASSGSRNYNEHLPKNTRWFEHLPEKFQGGSGHPSPSPCGHLWEHIIISLKRGLRISHALNYHCFTNNIIQNRISFISIKRYPQGANVYIIIHTMRNFQNTVIKRIMSDHLHVNHIYIGMMQSHFLMKVC